MKGHWWERASAIALAVVTCVVVAGGAAQADVLVAPNALVSVDGNSSQAVPLGGVGSGGSMRYLQVYATSEFSAFGVPLFIDQIAFRADASETGSFGATINDVQINFSTTSAAPDGLSSTFASNVGPDDTVVFSGPLSITGSGVGGPPRDFNTVISLETPFLYDPSAGNLLLDIRNLTGSGLFWLFDAELSADSVSRAFADFFGGGAAAATANNVDTRGLVTQFTVTPVPEPGTLLLVGSGLVSLAGWTARRRS